MMTDVIATAILATIPPTIVAIGGFVAVYKKQAELKVHINSRMDLLLKTSRDAGFAEGVIHGIKQKVEGKL